MDIQNAIVNGAFWLIMVIVSLLIVVVTGLIAYSIAPSFNLVVGVVVASLAIFPTARFMNKLLD